MNKFIGFLVFYFIYSNIGFAQNTYAIELLKNSSLTITGSTNICSFKLIQNGDKLLRNRTTITTTQSQNKIYLNQNQLSVMVKNFNSTNSMALRDFLKLIKADDYPSLQIQVISLDFLPFSDKDINYNAKAALSITITGKTKEYSIPIIYNANGTTITIEGNKKLNITDFGLKSQNKMIGLIKVSDWIDVDFHLICKITSDLEMVNAK